METVHICNTHFERELQENQEMSLEKALLLHPVFLQLQYLPILYANTLAVSHLASNEYLQNHSQTTIYTLDQMLPPEITTVSSWAPSGQIALWASNKKLQYQMCDFEIAKLVNSKAYAFNHTPHLERATLFTNLEEIEKWLAKGSYPKLLKSEYSTAGKGLLILHKKQDFNKKHIQHFLTKEFSKNRCIIGEPWVKRIIDFSTQWNITKNGEKQFIGLTFFESDAKGIYRKTFVTKPLKKYEQLIEKHYIYAEAMLNQLIREGYFGHVGFDAMIYEKNKKPTLHPIVEINARMTMSFIAIICQKKFYPNNDITFAYLPTRHRQEGLLPTCLKINSEKIIEFNHQIFLEKI